MKFFSALCGIIIAILINLIGINISSIVPEQIQYPVGFLFGALAIITIVIYIWPDNKN